MTAILVRQLGAARLARWRPGLSRAQPGPRAEPATAPATADRLRWPAIVLASGFGLLCIGAADAQSRLGGALALPLFWLGMLALFLPATVRLYAARRVVRVDGAIRAFGPSRTERLAIVVVLGLALYLVKVMVNPLGFALPDEFSHLRTLEDILRTGHLFAENPLLQVSALYPGLEATTATTVLTTGLDAFPAAMLVIGLARLVGVLALFLLAERVTRSARVGGLAAVIYMANPSFLAFDSVFAYESLALPLALTALWATSAWVDTRGRRRVYPVIAVSTIVATAATHHLTSFALVGFLLVWTAISVVRERPGGAWRILLLATEIALASVLVWFAIAGTLAITYLSKILNGGFQELVGIVLGTGEARRLFATHAGFAAPFAEVIASYAAVGLLVLALPIVLLYAVRRRRRSAIVYLLCLAALLYPASLALRFTTAGAEASQRASEFLFVALSILGAEWLVGAHPWRWRPRRAALVVPAILLLVAGGIATGDPPVGRFPGPYHVAAEARSIEPEGIAAATWALVNLPPDARLVADRTNAKLLGSYGLDYPVTQANSQTPTAYPMFAETLDPTLLDVLVAGQVRYIVVDLRLAEDVGVYPYLFEEAEPDAGDHTTPMSLTALQKWDQLPGVTRIYDSGDIIVYDIGALTHAGS